MTPLATREFHRMLNGRFVEVGSMEAIGDYGDARTEHAALQETAGVLDLSFRSRLCLTGADRTRFLHGQVTNDVNGLKSGEGCYAALVNAKGRIESDLNIYCLENEFLLDFEPGLSGAVAQRFEKYIIADDVQTVDVAAHYGLLSVQGPKAGEVVAVLAAGTAEAGRLAQPLRFVEVRSGAANEIYLMNQPRTGAHGFDIFMPKEELSAVFEKLLTAAKEVGGRACGWHALEMARIEAGIPRYGLDMDDTNLAPETGIEERAISYSKGCYIGQEVIARIRTYGQVAKALRGLRLADNLAELPVKGDKLIKDGREVGYITSAVASLSLEANIALGYARRECNEIGTELVLRTTSGESGVRIVGLPFRRE